VVAGAAPRRENMLPESFLAVIAMAI